MNEEEVQNQTLEILKAMRATEESAASKSTLKTAASILGILVVFCTLAFAAGNYPTRSEWEGSQKKQRDQVDRLKEEMADMRVEQVRLHSTMEGIRESQDRTEATQSKIRDTLDKALDRRR